MDDILRDIPDQIESERLILRSPQPGDGPIVYSAVCASLEALRAFPASMPWALEEPSVDISETFCRQSRVDYLSRKNPDHAAVFEGWRPLRRRQRTA